MSLSETPVTVEKLVGPVVSLKKMSPPAARALDVRKLTVYVVVALASADAGVTVAPVTELPKVIEFVAWAVPVAGWTVMEAIADELGLVALNVIVRVPPFATGVAKVRDTIEVLVGVMPVTASFVADATGRGVDHRVTRGSGR